MSKFQSGNIGFVPKRTLFRYPSEVAPDHNAPQYMNNHFKPKYSGDFLPQSSMKPWVPNNHNQYERPPSMLSTDNLDFPSNHRTQFTQSKHTNNKMPCSKILKIVSVVFIVALILVAVTLSIYTFVSMKMYSAATTTTPTTTTTTTTTSATSAILPTQCFSYTFNNDVTRLATAAGGLATDSGMFGGAYVWYRFYGSGGTNIVTTAPTTNRCGGMYSGWYAGTLPTYGNTCTGTVCFTNANICSYSTTILVTNCGSYNVYGLINTPVLYGRYCTV